MIGRTVSHFSVIEKLGGGAMGVVYKARDLHLDRMVALKFLPPHLSGEEDKSRLIREAKAASALDHPHLCTIHDIDETEEGQLFIAMAFYQGETVKKKIERGPLPVGEAILIAIQTAEGLAEAHRHGILHRDIKPANLMVTDDGNVKIVDFGVAKLTGQTTITRTGATLGTPAYMSPEQVRGEPLDERTDLWALGVVLYEMLSGDLPFRGDYPQALTYSILNEPATPLTAPSGVPAELERIVTRTLAKDRDGRFQSADEMLADLRAVRASLGLDAEISTEGRVRPRWRSRLSAYGVIAAVAVLLAAAGLLVWRLAEPVADRGPPIESAEARKLFDRAQSYERQGYTPAKLAAAEQLYRRALALDPENSFLEAHLGAHLAQMQRQYPAPGRLEEIQALAGRALEADPGLAPAWVALGTVQLLEGEAAAAEAAARKATQSAPRDHEGFALLGDALIAQGRVEEGLAQLRTGVETGTGYVWAREAFAFKLLELGRLNEAEAEFQKVLEYAPDSPSALNNLAVIYLFEGRYTDALPRLNQLRRLEPEDDVVVANLGFALHSLGRGEEAVEAYREAHELAPRNSSHMHGLAEAYERLGAQDAARQWFETALESYARELTEGGPRARLLASRAVCAAKLGRFAEAAAQVEEALALEPNNHQLLFFAAQVYAEAGDSKRTFEATRRALAAGSPRSLFQADLSFHPYRNDPDFRALLELELVGAPEGEVKARTVPPGPTH